MNKAAFLYLVTAIGALKCSLFMAVRGLVRSLSRIFDILMWERVIIRTEIIVADNPDNSFSIFDKRVIYFADLSTVALKFESLKTVF